MDGTVATDPAITLPSNRESQWLIHTASYSVIGTKTLDGSEAEVFFWDRISSTFNARYSIGDTEAICGFVISGIPYIVTKQGAISRFTGQGFRKVQQFPTLELGKQISDINPNGVMVQGDSAIFNVNFGASADMRILSGIWVYDSAKNNLYHRNSVRNDSGNDYSQQEVSAVGALVETSPTQGRFLCGAKAYTAYTSSTLTGIFTSDEDSTSGARGYFITPKMPSSSSRKYFKRILTKYKKMEAGGDNIRLLYRISESSTLPAYETITWVTSTTFTGSDANVAVNDFVEIIAGDNAGAIAKITTIVAGTPKTFTIDLTLNSSVKAARARYLNFKDIASIADTSGQEVFKTINTRGNWIQFLVELRGTESSPHLEELLLEFTDLER